MPPPNTMKPLATSHNSGSAATAEANSSNITYVLPFKPRPLMVPGEFGRDSILLLLGIMNLSLAFIWYLGINGKGRELAMLFILSIISIAILSAVVTIATSTFDSTRTEWKAQPERVVLTPVLRDLFIHLNLLLSLTIRLC